MEKQDAAGKSRAPRMKCYLAPDMLVRGDIVKRRWEVKEKLGAGTFGQVYKVRDLQTNLEWALKVESQTARKPVLRMDVAIARALHGKKHFVKFFACGHEENFSYMVTQLLGRSLASRKRSSHDGRFPLRTVVRIGVQATQGIQYLHESGYIHRDIKPSNLATGVGENDHVIYLIDFGLARKYLDDKGHIFPIRPKTSFRGTVRYASPRAHMMQELSRRDDVWSLLYTLVDLYAGTLPWHNIRDTRRVGQAKLLVSGEELCRGLPETWRQIYALCKEMAYESVPHYEFIKDAMNAVSPRCPAGLYVIKQMDREPWEWETPIHQEASGSSM